MAPKKGSKLFHNLETKEALLFDSDPGPLWVKGRPPWQPQTRDPKQYEKSSQTMKKRLRECGPTEAELSGYKKQSRTRLEGDYSPTKEVRQQISETLTGRPQKWEENKSRASCRKWDCDTVYVLKLTLPDGKSFGKWGSSKESTFKYREKEFKRKHFSLEVVYWEWFGELTEEVEALLGRRFSPHRDPQVPHFYGHTETFAWTSETQTLLSEVLNGLEKNTAS
jgi:hypothetical protein